MCPQSLGLCAFSIPIIPLSTAKRKNKNRWPDYHFPKAER
ncbi:hypothetical protein NC652_027049 [Populus alba x Populus x berolinensis]|nr:hypothetical protein NC652_027049 [Populus alba x Populus x berolinensis]